jgi:activator of HSP90 ATPase
MIGSNEATSVSGLPTRRQFVTGASIALGGLAAVTALKAAPGTAKSTLHYEVECKAAPQKVYDALLEAKQFSAWSGLPAEIDPREGGRFSLFQAQIVGRIVELVPDKRIVQAWRPAHWDQGIYSIVKFELKPHGTGSTLLLDHTGFPEAESASLDSGWQSHYIAGLTKYFA